MRKTFIVVLCYVHLYSICITPSSSQLLFNLNQSSKEIIGSFTPKNEYIKGQKINDRVKVRVTTTLLGYTIFLNTYYTSYVYKYYKILKSNVM